MSALREKQSRFIRYVGMLISHTYQLGYELTAGEFYRTPEQATYNALHGLGIANSLHTQRLAVDFNLFKDGIYLTSFQAYEPLGLFWENLAKDCAWGGRFSKPDLYHFSIAHDGIR